MNVNNLIWGLEELSDKELQEKLWLGKSEGEMSSFVEAISSTFDDSGLGKILDSKGSQDEVSVELREKALQLGRLIRRVPQSAAPLDTINHPEMNAVRDLAGEMLALLKK